MRELLVEDLDSIYRQIEYLMPEFQNKTILITGATGFVGSWILDSLLYARNRMGLDFSIIVLTRDSSKVTRLGLNVIQGDVRTFKCKNKVDYILHFASHDGHRLTIDNPIEMYDIIANGALNVLNLAKEYNAKLLYMSSGVVEKAEVNPYVMGKVTGEYLCELFYKQYSVDVKIARGFDFIGARLPLNKHFAVGNFIKDVLEDKPVNVYSDGMAVRSYLYMSDVVVWLLTLLFKGQPCITYNIGSDKAVSIGGLARKVAEYGRYCQGINIESKVRGGGDCYYPPINNTFALGLKQKVSLDESISKTIRWYKDAER